MKSITTHSFEETQKLGEDFAANLKTGDVILLYGNLGAGKTTFMQGLAKGLGIKNRIISPTFIIVRSYDLNSNLKKLYHIDLYRCESQNDLESIGLSEIISEKQAIVAIEWPEKMGSALPKEYWELQFTYIDDDTRRIDYQRH